VLFGLTTYSAILIGLLINTIRRPATVLGAVLCMYGLEQWGQGNIPLLLQHQTLTNFIIGGLVLLAGGLSVFRGGHLLSHYPTVGWATLFLIGYSFVSSLWTSRLDLSAKQLIDSIPYFATIVLATPLIFSKEQHFKEGLLSYMVVGSVLAILVLSFGNWGLRGLSLGWQTQTNPLALAQMAGGVVLALLLLNIRGNAMWLLLKWIVAALCIVLVVRTSSRGQVLALLVAGILCWPMSRRVNNLWTLVSWAFAIGMALIITGIALDYYFKGDPRWEIRNAIFDAEGRLGLAFTLLQHWIDGGPLSILFGLGNSASFDPKIVGFYPHVMPLEVLGEEGVLGFTLLGYVVIASIRNTLRAYRKMEKNPEARGVLATLAALSLMTFILSFKQGSLLGSTELFLYVILLGRYCEVIQDKYKVEVCGNLITAPQLLVSGQKQVKRHQSRRLGYKWNG
jgi:hypothetical protein